MNVYARVRDERLGEVAERVGRAVMAGSGHKSAPLSPPRRGLNIPLPDVNPFSDNGLGELVKVEAGGIEPNPMDTKGLTTMGHPQSSSGEKSAPLLPHQNLDDLARVVAAWPQLPEVLKTAILAVVAAGTEEHANPVIFSSG